MGQDWVLEVEYWVMGLGYWVLVFEYLWLVVNEVVRHGGDGCGCDACVVILMVLITICHFQDTHVGVHPATA